MYLSLCKKWQTAALKAKIVAKLQPAKYFLVKHTLQHTEKSFVIKTYNKAFNLLATFNKCYFTANFVLFWF